MAARAPHADARPSVEGELPIGLTLDGVTHRRFTLRAATLGDNIAAYDLVGGDNPIALSTAMYARQLVTLGTLPREQITYELLTELYPVDFNALDQVASEIVKKLRPGAAAASNGSASDSPSAVPG